MVLGLWGMTAPNKAVACNVAGPIVGAGVEQIAATLKATQFGGAVTESAELSSSKVS